MLDLKQIKQLLKIKNNDLNIAYKNRNTNIIYSMIKRKEYDKPKKKKEIDWNIFTKTDLIKIAEKYEEITKEKKKRDEMKEAKNLDLLVPKLVFLLGISKFEYYKNRKVTYKSRRNSQLELSITKVFYD